MMINKKITFGNGIIPSTKEYFDAGIMPILKHMLSADIYWNKNSRKVAQELRNARVHNYSDLIMASWNNINWV